MTENFDCTVSTATIKRTWRRYIETGSIADRARSGRPKSLTLRAQRVVRRIAKRCRTALLCRLAGQASNVLGAPINSTIVRRMLARYVLKRRIAARVPYLTLKQNNKRVA